MGLKQIVEEIGILAPETLIFAIQTLNGTLEQLSQGPSREIGEGFIMYE